MSNCLWTLDVTVVVIDMKHAEKRNGEFCCCDDDYDKNCKKSLSELGMCTEGKCDLLLNVTVSPCTESTSSGPCSIITEGITNAEKFGDYRYVFYFTTISQANKVRKCFYTTQPFQLIEGLRTRVLYNPQTKNIKFCIWCKNTMKLICTTQASVYKNFQFLIISSVPRVS